MSEGYRQEHDLLGDREVPNRFYFGIQTLRALENFDLTGIPISSTPSLVTAFAYVKKAAALTNLELGLLSAEIAQAIAKACDEIITGELHDQFVVDVLQGGAGTSTNMNANEVIANRALEIMGHEKGDYQHCHPNNHVNCSQSTNDAYPTAFRIALHVELRKLMSSMEILQKTFADKGVEFADVLKMGRTQLQDAVPMTLGNEFSGYAEQVRKGAGRLRGCFANLEELALGGTAIGTGLNTHPAFGATAIGYISGETGCPFVGAVNRFEAIAARDSQLELMGAINTVAVSLMKIAQDLRLLSSGPRAAPWGSPRGRTASWPSSASWDRPAGRGPRPRGRTGGAGCSA